MHHNLPNQESPNELVRWHRLGREMSHDHKFKRYDLPAGGYTEQCVVCGEYLPTIVDAIAAGLAAEKMAHSVTIAEEHESRTAFQDRIRDLEAQ